MSFFIQQFFSMNQSQVIIDNTPWYNTSWNYRMALDVDYTKVPSQQTNFPLYVDLSVLGSNFHSNVSATAAQDIRITCADGITECAREIVAYDSTTDTGELWFKGLTISSTQSTRFYLYYGNSGATEPAATASYGKYNVWSSGSFAYVGHLQSSPVDSTSNQRATSTFNSPTYSTAKFGKGIEGPGNYVTYSTLVSNRTQLDSATYLNWVGNNHYSIWANMDSATSSFIDGFGSQAIFGRQDNSNPRLINSLVLRNNSGIYYSISFRVDGNYTVYSIGSSSSTPYQSGWNKFDFWRNGSNIVLAINGVIAGTTSASSGNATVTASGGVPLGIGYLRMSANENIGISNNSFFDEFRIRTSTYPTSDYILTEYNNQNNPVDFYDYGSQQSKP